MQPATIVVLVLTGLTVLCLVLVEISSRRNARKQHVLDSQNKQPPVIQGQK